MLDILKQVVSVVEVGDCYTWRPLENIEGANKNGLRETLYVVTTVLFGSRGIVDTVWITWLYAPGWSKRNYEVFADTPDKEIERDTYIVRPIRYRYWPELV